VALKFLPRALAEDPVRRERFFAEVRITRQLSHPNICRVYDIAEVDGQHFLSMEYIDGEDLASLAAADRVSVQRESARWLPSSRNRS
jgi:serine/threonine protein kinase